jgi:thioesterase domain-containing protein
MAHDYRPTGTVNASLLAFESETTRGQDEMLAWKPFTTGNYRHEYIKGEHHELLDLEHLPVFVEYLTSFLEQETQKTLQQH